MPRVLIADDMVPDRSLSSVEDVRAHYSSLYPGTDFADGCAFVYELLNLLRSEGYVVDVANTRAQALRLAASESYAIIILDLGWWAEKAKRSKDEKMVLGFEMADEIHERSPAQIVMFSNRFFEDENLAKRAAEKGCLPVFKSYNNVSAKSLLVTVRWALFRRTPAEMALDQMKFASLRMYKRLNTVLLWSVILTTIMLVAAVPLAVLKQTSETIIASVFGTVTAFLSHVLYRGVSEYRKAIS